MPFCTRCGKMVGNTDSFCTGCGNRLNQQMVPVRTNTVVSQIELVRGQEVRFPLLSETIVVSREMDVFNTYRKQFSFMAKKKVGELHAEYCARIKDLDSFLIVFPEIYQKHRSPLINAAMEVLYKAEIYDISQEQFEQDHTADFCLCGEDVDNMIESFNLTIEANQDKKIRMYNMMPGMVFSGIGGFAAALAVNVAVTKIAENDIKNANVSSKQRAELFSRVDTNTLMERAYIDYWRVFLSLTYILNQRGLGVWYPTVDCNNRAEGLFQNLASGRIPPDKVLPQISLLYTLNPYNDNYLSFLTHRYGLTPETKAICTYFSV